MGDSHYGVNENVKAAKEQGVDLCSPSMTAKGSKQQLLTLEQFDLDDRGLSGGARPRFIVTDHGSQFRREFRSTITKMSVAHVRCQVHTWQLNFKVERVFSDIKAWAAKSLLPTKVACV